MWGGRGHEYKEESEPQPLLSSVTAENPSREVAQKQRIEGVKPNKSNEKLVDQEDQAFLEELERLKSQEKEANDAAEALRKEKIEDERGVVVRNKARLVTQGHRQEEGIDYDESDVKSAFLYGILMRRFMCIIPNRAYSEIDLSGANLDRKYTKEVGQFLGRRLISWKCKKQTIMATSTTEAKYVAAAN
ncbi:hypothetical protein Tco_0703486 [Tanacetum coccineum]|uniref:Uncharacterized protein n=1 Tax=Tanacetum coccineum TaxID=301880 RepID=A0ABQ4Y0R8_9ASTR